MSRAERPATAGLSKYQCRSLLADVEPARSCSPEERRADGAVLEVVDPLEISEDAGVRVVVGEDTVRARDAESEREVGRQM